MKIRVLVIVSVVLAPGWAFAQNGVVQINQSIVAAGGNRATNGFPYTITQPGSYQLTSNLSVPAGTNGIVINASGVTLDLNGFSLIGNCTSECNSAGVTDNGVAESGITVRNGTVQTFGFGIGFFKASGVRIEKVAAQSNTANGIEAGGIGNIIIACLAINNTGTGVLAGQGSTITDSVATANGAGILIGQSSTIKGNSASGNQLTGIGAGSGSTLTANTATLNGDGIVVGQGSTLTGNTASLNGGRGFILVQSGVMLTGNTAVNNIAVDFVIACPSNLVGNTALGGAQTETETGTGCNKSNNLF